MLKLNRNCPSYLKDKNESNFTNKLFKLLTNLLFFEYHISIILNTVLFELLRLYIIITFHKKIDENL